MRAKRKRSKYRAIKRGCPIALSEQHMDDAMRYMMNSFTDALYAPNPLMASFPNKCFETELTDKSLFRPGSIQIYPKMYPSLAEINSLNNKIVKNQKLMEIPGFFISSCELPPGILKPDSFGMNLPQVSEITCEHTFANYVGLTESYNYCTKCDKKDTGL